YLELAETCFKAARWMPQGEAAEAKDGCGFPNESCCPGRSITERSHGEGYFRRHGGRLDAFDGSNMNQYRAQSPTEPPMAFEAKIHRRCRCGNGHHHGSIYRTRLRPQ